MELGRESPLHSLAYMPKYSLEGTVFKKEKWIEGFKTNIKNSNVPHIHSASVKTFTKRIAPPHISRANFGSNEAYNLFT